MATTGLRTRINDFSELGDWLRKPVNLELLVEKALTGNPWFTSNNTRLAINGISKWLFPDVLSGWLQPYGDDSKEKKTIGVVMPGNIPLAGFHDYLSVLITGNKLKAKLSSQDNTLLKIISEQLIQINSYWQDRIEFVEQIKAVDGVIATGSNNTARYFEYYFRHIPLLLRKNRNSIAVLTGEESESKLLALGEDIFSYYGLGCRNVSLVFISDLKILEKLINAVQSWSHIIEHHKYANSYIYQRALMLMDLQPFTDTGFFILRESELTSSPIGVLHYQLYSKTAEVQTWIEKNSEQLQCIVGEIIPGSIPFGKAQHPQLDDYADNIDTLRFIKEINSD